MRHWVRQASIVLLIILCWGCAPPAGSNDGSDAQVVAEPTIAPPEPNEPPAATLAAPASPIPPVTPSLADVTAVTTTGEAGAYRFAVTISSPDTGCDQYADWWEVVSTDGELLYRRILAHSHVDEQPFTRSGGPVAVAAETEVIVRAHMMPGGYGGQALQGSAAGGFVPVELPADFAPELVDQPPLPSGCTF